MEHNDEGPDLLGTDQVLVRSLAIKNGLDPDEFAAHVAEIDRLQTEVFSARKELSQAKESYGLAVSHRDMLRAERLRVQSELEKAYAAEKLDVGDFMPR